MPKSDDYLVAVIGAGPAGLFGAFELASQGAQVVLFNRDIKPGGLAEYGVYPSKYRLKQGLRAQFRTILSMQGIEYCGNVTIGEHGDIRLGELADLGFHAVLVGIGAQGIKWLGLPGEDLIGVIHAKDLVYFYNKLPPFSENHFALGSKVAIIGVGNVMVDIARFLIEEGIASEIYPIARRGPAEVKFDKKELASIANNLDVDDYQKEVDAASDLMKNMGEDPVEAMQYIRDSIALSEPGAGTARVAFRFLRSPKRILDDGNGKVGGVILEENTLYSENGEIKARGTGREERLDVDTVIYAIGDRVDENFGLPVAGLEFHKNPDPRFPIDDTSFELLDPRTGNPIDQIFVAGWARIVSKGQVGIAHKDGVNAARAMLQFLDSRKDWPTWSFAAIHQRLAAIDKPVVGARDLIKLSKLEEKLAEEQGLPEYKFNTNADMLRAAGYQV